MSRPRARFGLGIASTVVISGIASASDALFPAPSLSPEDAVRLEAGELLVSTIDVPGTSIPMVRAKAIFEAPPERVWPIIDECANYRNTMPRVIESAELSRREEKVRCRLVLDMPFPLSNLVAITDATHEAKPGRFSRVWTLHEGDFVENRGEWILDAYRGGRTLAHYEIHSVPDVPVPGFIIRLGIDTTLPSLFDGIRERVEAPAGAS